jgi:AcrR family transcriptional regulator
MGRARHKADTERTAIGAPSPARERIVEAMLDLVSERGYQGATTRAIAERAGVAEPTVFRIFGTKEAIFEASVRAHSFLPLLQSMVATLDARDLRADLRTIGRAYLSLLRERKRLIRILVSEITTYPEKAREAHAGMVRDMTKTLSVYFGRALAPSVKKRIAPAVAAQTFLRLLFAHFLVEGVLLDRELSDGEIRKTVSAYVDVLLAGLGGEKEEAS